MGEELGGGKCAVVAAVVIGSPMPTASGDRARLLSAADAVSPISPRLWPVVCGEAMATAGYLMVAEWGGVACREVCRLGVT